MYIYFSGYGFATFVKHDLICHTRSESRDLIRHNTYWSSEPNATNTNATGSAAGETGRNLNIWLTDRKRATRNGDINNHIAEHHLKTNHRIDWDSVECVTYNTDVRTNFSRIDRLPNLLPNGAPLLRPWAAKELRYKRTRSARRVWDQSVAMKTE